ncbi:ABC transporter permease subunit [Chloroflexota bacterium]
MLANIFTKTVRDSWRGIAIAAGSLALMLFFAMLLYRDIDLNFYTDLPDALLSIMGIPAGADIGSLAIGELFAAYGAWVLVGLAIAAGSAFIAGEESKGTIGLLLGNPRSRTNVLVSKAASMVLLMSLAGAFLWGSTYLIAGVLDVNITGMTVGALSLHMFVNALFYGFLAMAIGAWTGNRGTAAGVTVGLMFVSIFAVGLLPLIEGWENVAKMFPWYYFNGSEPLLNGIDWNHIGVLFAGITLFAVIAVIGVNRRDLRGQNVGVTLLDRFRGNPMTKKIANRLAGSTRVSRIWIKTLSEHQVLLIITGYVMFLIMGILIGPIYNWMPADLFDILDQFPEALLAAFGGGDMSTPEGFYQAETFGLMAPIALMVVTITVGARALAGEEGRRTMGLLLANPIKRSKIVIEKAWAMVACASTVGFATFAGVTIGSLLGGLGMDIGNIAAMCLLVTLLGLAFGALAFALSAATGRGKAAVFGSIGTAIVFYLANSLLPLSESVADYAKWSPFYYYLSSDPLLTGMDWGHGAILAGLTLGLVVLSVVLFQRRDLRYTG